MWWVFAGWLALSGCAAAVFHLARRRPVTTLPGTREFLLSFAQEIGQHHPRVELRGMIPGRFAVLLSIRGQEVPVSLHPLFRRCAVFPLEFGSAVDRFLDELESCCLDTCSDHEFAEVATSILPQVRSTAWLRAHGARFGDAALVHRPLNDELVVCYVIDEPWCMTFVCRAQLRQWGCSEPDLLALATSNLKRLAGPQVPIPGPDAQPLLLRTGDGFDAARVLLLDPEQVEGLLVAVPERDVLWVSSGPSDQLAELMARNAEHSERALHPVSPRLYRVEAGALAPVDAGAAP